MSRSIATGLRSFLDAHAASDGVPVSLNKVPQTPGIERFVVIHRLSTENYTTLDDPGDDSLRAETFRITAYARTTEPADELADAIAEALDDYEGAMGSDRRCEAVFIEDESGDYDPPLYVDGFDTAELVVMIQHSPAA